MDFKTFFDTSRAQLRQGKPAQVRRAESSGPDRLALYTLTPNRPPVAACTGIDNLVPEVTAWISKWWLQVPKRMIWVSERVRRRSSTRSNRPGPSNIIFFSWMCKKEIKIKIFWMSTKKMEKSFYFFLILRFFKNILWWLQVPKRIIWVLSD